MTEFLGIILAIHLCVRDPSTTVDVRIGLTMVLLAAIGICWWMGDGYIEESLHRSIIKRRLYPGEAKRIRSLRAYSVISSAIVLLAGTGVIVYLWLPYAS